MEQHTRHTMDETKQGVFLQHHDDTEIHAPEDKVPTRTVPKTCQEPHCQDVERLVATIATEGNVDVVAEETSQRDVPSAPELGDASANVGMRKVFVEVET